MRTPFKTIGIIGKPSDPGIAETLTKLYSFLTEKQYTVFIDNNSTQFIAGSPVNACQINQMG